MPRRNQEVSDDEKALQSISTLIEEYDEDGARLTKAQELISDIRELLIDEGYMVEEEAEEIDEEVIDEEEAA